MRAVVFAYHNVGCRCLSVLLAHGVKVALVVTHDDDPGEAIWFDSVERLALLHDLPVAKPADPNAAQLVARVRSAAPDFLFSFYYRQMLSAALLEIPARGALNMHGSLLPKYRGRVPVNWAVLHGERETGATLHYMVDKPDAGDIVAQQAVPILPEDTAAEVFNKVTVAAELALDRALPDLLNGCAPRMSQDLSRGGYFGGRRREDGRIDWTQPAAAIHNLVRAVSPPYPGAFTQAAGRLVRFLGVLLQPGRRGRFGRPALWCEAGRCYLECADGAVLRVVRLEVDGTMLCDETFQRTENTPPVYLT
jgi:methionyl-tRNA formyltransferase